MTTFTLHLQSATQYDRIENVTAFTAEDATGSFTLLAGHERFLTNLTFGLARFRTTDAQEYLALPGALAYFTQNELFLNTRRYLRSPDYEHIRTALQQQFAAEEEQLHELKRSLERLEQEMLKRLLEINRKTTA